MFEGEGAWVSANKFISLEHAFVGGLFLLGSNALPYCANGLSGDYDSCWKPIIARGILVKMIETHEGEFKFPYSALDLASAFQYYINMPQAEVKEQKVE